MQANKRAVFPVIDASTWRLISRNYRTPIKPTDTDFWRWVRDNNLPITETESPRDAAVLLVHGFIAAALMPKHRSK
jgi:hypothetical protein